jgi:hypothetical protein
MRVQKLLVTLDSLMDTRIACVHLLDHTHTGKLLRNGYMKRVHNKLSLFVPEINDDAVDELFSIRDVPVLKLARPTNVVNLLAERILEAKLLQDKSPENKEVKIVLNTYPYNLSKQEVYDFVKGFSDILQTKNITRVHLPIEELTPEYLLPNYSAYITHDLNEWIAIHEVNVNKLKMPLFTIISPGYFRDITELRNLFIEHSVQMTESNINKHLQAGLNAFKKNVAQFVELEFYPLSDFSVTPVYNSCQKQEQENQL